MSEKELKALAREYAEQNPPAGIKDNVLKENAISLNALIFEKYLQWLSSRFCLVEKGKVLDEYRECYPENPNRDIVAIVCDQMLHRLFGSELFNEPKQ